MLNICSADVFKGAKLEFNISSEVSKYLIKKIIIINSKF